MIKHVEHEGNILYIEVTEMITKEDVEYIIPIIDKIVEEYDQMKSIIFLNNVKGYTVEGFLADFNFFLKHHKVFGAIAVVGDKEFEKLLVRMFENMLPERAKYFDASELDKAKEWIKQV